MEKKVKLELCSFSLNSSVVADRAGADRIELCGGFLEGGTTPSPGLIKNTLAAVSIPVYVMIRPRGGDFLYSESEFQVMKEDIIEIKKLGPAGFVFGLLTAEGKVDRHKTEELIRLAAPHPVTFHRAFDVCDDPFEALETLIELGCENILTSGQQNSAEEGIDLLAQLAKQADGRINIMAGSGVGIKNASGFIEAGLDALHFTAKKAVESGMTYRKDTVKMGDEHVDEYLNFEADPQRVSEVKALIQR